MQVYNKLLLHRFFIILIRYIISKVAFNARELCHPNDSNGSAETSDESGSGRFSCEEKIEAPRYVKSNISTSICKTVRFYTYLFFIIDATSANEENNEMSEVDLLGEGKESGELVPGKSLVFAILEVCLCLLVRQIPALNPNPGGATAILSQKGYVPSEESGKLISLSLNIMESLPTLCSPQGILPILIVSFSSTYA